MPKGFTETEIASIKQSLISAGIELFGQYGLKKCSVDDIIARAGIAKGSFYNIYPSKEEFFFTCLEELEERIEEEEILPLLSADMPPQEKIARLLELEFRLTEQYPLMAAALKPTEFELLMRKLPPERIGKHIEKDALESRRYVELIFPDRVWNDDQIGVITALFRGILAVQLNKELVGEQYFDSMSRLLSRSIGEGLAIMAEEDRI